LVKRESRFKNRVACTLHGKKKMIPTLIRLLIRF
jgi:hypothetical protein